LIRAPRCSRPLCIILWHVDERTRRAIAHADGHDPPWLVGEVVPRLAAKSDDVIVDSKILFDSQLSRMNCQTFSTGFSSGDRGGSGRRVTDTAASPIKLDTGDGIAASNQPKNSDRSPKTTK